MSSAATDSRKSPLPNKANSTKETSNRNRKPLKVEPFFSDPQVSPFDQIEWVKRSATISGEAGEVVFEQNDAEVPKSFSQLATKVVVSKYFYGELGTDERENSFRDLVHRVTRTIADWGLKDGIFTDQAQADLYYRELSWLCLNQYAAFNSPV